MKLLGFENLSIDDNIVLLIGPTGSGKSSLIEVATGVAGLAGDGLEPQTRVVTTYKCRFPELRSSEICFIDTPGFGDAEKKPELEVFSDLSRWLIELFNKDLQLRGVLYFHPISDNRMGWTPQCLKRIRQLVGNDCKIILTTTMWDQVGVREGSRRETQLKNTVKDRRFAFKRFCRNRDSVIDVLSPLFSAKGIISKDGLRSSEGFGGRLNTKASTVIENNMAVGGSTVPQIVLSIPHAESLMTDLAKYMSKS